MQVRTALKGISFKTRKSEKTYEGTDQNLVYLALDGSYHGQDYLVLSASAASEMLAAEDQIAYLAQCEVSYDEDTAAYGIIRRQTTEVLFEHTF